MKCNCVQDRSLIEAFASAFENSFCEGGIMWGFKVGVGLLLEIWMSIMQVSHHLTTAMGDHNIDFALRFVFTVCLV